MSETPARSDVAAQLALWVRLRRVALIAGLFAWIAAAIANALEGNWSAVLGDVGAALMTHVLLGEITKGRDA